MSNWEIRGEGVIIEGERIVAVVDKQEDAELICKLVNNYLSLNAVERAILYGDRDLGEIKIGGTE